MKKIYQSIFFLILTGISGAFAQTGTWLWQQLPGVTTTAGSNSHSCDAQGNIYVGGTFRGEITFGTQTFVNTNTSVQGNMYLAKYDNSGNVLWAKTASGVYSSVHDIATDNEGNIYVSGHFINTLTIDSTTLTAISTGESIELYIAKMDPDGNILWATNAGCNGVFTSIYPEDMEVDAQGNLYITGTAIGDSATFDGLTYEITGERDLFLAKYNSGGNISWLKGAGTKMKGENSCSLVVDNQGDIYVTGGYENNTPINFEGQILPNTGTWNTFLTKYHDDGTLVWAKAYHANIVYPRAIATDGDSIYISGMYNATAINFDTFSLAESQDNDVFLAKFDADGNAQWANKFAGSGSDYAGGGLVSKNNGIYLAGYFSSPELTFGENSVDNTGANSLFIAAFNNNGILQWLDSTGPGLQNLRVSDISVTNDGYVYLNGSFNQGMTFGNNTYTITTGNQPYLAKYNPATLSATSFTKKGVTLYPNPAKDIINIAGIEDGPFIITDVTGRTVAQGQMQANVINLSQLPSGMYLLNVNNATTKFIKE